MGSITLNTLPKLVEECGSASPDNTLGKAKHVWDPLHLETILTTGVRLLLAGDAKGRDYLRTRGFQGLKVRFWVRFDAGVIVRLRPA